MKVKIPIIDLSEQQIDNVLKKSNVTLPRNESKKFKEELATYIRNYFIVRYQNRKPSQTNTKEKLQIIARASEKIGVKLKTPLGSSRSEIIPSMNRGALMKKFDRNFNDLEDLVWEINISAEQAIQSIELREQNRDKAKPGTKPNAALNDLINDLSWLWYSTLKTFPGVSRNGPFARVIYYLFKELRNNLNQQLSKIDPNLDSDLFLTQEAIKNRLEHMPIIKYKKCF